MDFIQRCPEFRKGGKESTYDTFLPTHNHIRCVLSQSQPVPVFAVLAFGGDDNRLRITLHGFHITCIRAPKIKQENEKMLHYCQPSTTCYIPHQSTGVTIPVRSFVSLIPVIRYHTGLPASHLRRSM